jgi:hypothetical protein
LRSAKALERPYDLIDRARAMLSAKLRKKFRIRQQGPINHVMRRFRKGFDPIGSKGSTKDQAVRAAENRKNTIMRE